MTRKKSQPPRDTPSGTNSSWLPGRKGQGGEGLSKGYGGSAGAGTGPAGPETPGAGKDDQAETTSSSSLPSRERIRKVLR